MNTDQKKQIINIVESKGYRPSKTDESTWINDAGKKVKFSSTGQSLIINSYGGYNTPNGVRKSSHF